MQQKSSALGVVAFICSATAVAIDLFLFFPAIGHGIGLTAAALFGLMFAFLAVPIGLLGALLGTIAVATDRGRVIAIFAILFGVLPFLVFLR